MPTVKQIMFFFYSDNSIFTSNIDSSQCIYFKWLRDGFKTQPPVDRGFRPVPPSFYCSKQWQLPGTGRNRRSTGGWVLKSPLIWIFKSNCTLQKSCQLSTDAHAHYLFLSTCVSELLLPMESFRMTLTHDSQLSILYLHQNTKVFFSPPCKTHNQIEILQ